MIDSLSSFAALRRRIALLEGRQREAGRGVFASGHAGLDGALGGGFARGRVHELFGAGVEDAGAAAAFAALLALLALRDGSEGRGGTQGPLLWLRTDGAVRRAGRLYGPGLADLGIDPARLLLGIMPDDGMLLRAAADALRCRALDAVVIECWGDPALLDLTASRRLTLAAEAAGTTAILLRLGGTPSPSAAETRWRIAAAPSVALPANAPGHAAFDINLLRRRAGPDGLAWRLEWNRDRKCFVEPGEQALPGALVSFPAARPAAPRAA